MKSRVLILGLFIILLGISVNAQQYNPLVLENAQWRVEYDNDVTPWPDAMLGWLLRGDTLINDQQYKKLFRRVFEDPSSNVIDTQFLYGFLREDTAARIIYALESESLGCDTLDQEYILFDFSYEVGDTSQLCMHTELLGHCILLDTHYTNIYGADRKIFEFCNSSCTFIEGIGHDQGLLESPVINMSGGVITSLDDYCVGTDEECDVLYVKVDEPFQTVQYQVYPNPVSDWIHILFGEHKRNWFSDREMQIFNVYGAKVGAEKMPNITESYSHNISNLPQGLYLLVIRERQKVVYTGKFLIAR